MERLYLVAHVCYCPISACSHSFLPHADGACCVESGGENYWHDVLDSPFCFFTCHMQCSLRKKQTELWHSNFGVHLSFHASNFVCSRYLLDLCSEVATIPSALGSKAVSTSSFRGRSFHLFHILSTALASGYVLLRTVKRKGTVHTTEN